MSTMPRVPCPDCDGTKHALADRCRQCSWVWMRTHCSACGREVPPKRRGQSRCSQCRSAEERGGLECLGCGHRFRDDDVFRRHQTSDGCLDPKGMRERGLMLMPGSGGGIWRRRRCRHCSRQAISDPQDVRLCEEHKREYFREADARHRARHGVAVGSWRQWEPWEDRAVVSDRPLAVLAKKLNRTAGAVAARRYNLCHGLVRR